MRIRSFRLLRESMLDQIDPVGAITQKADQLANNIEDKTGLNRRNYYQRDDNYKEDSDEKSLGYTKSKLDPNNPNQNSGRPNAGSNKGNDNTNVPQMEIPIYFDLITVVNVNNYSFKNKDKVYTYTFNGEVLSIVQGKKAVRIQFSETHQDLKSFTKYEIKNIVNNGLLSAKQQLGIYRYFMLTKPTELTKNIK